MPAQAISQEKSIPVGANLLIDMFLSRGKISPHAPIRAKIIQFR
jgi:hypothetical protein